MSSFLAVLQSVLAAFIGVQNEHKRTEDFSQPSPWPYIITAIVMTLILILLLVLLVRWLSGTP